ncbi:hypothetical protein L596_000166 [Steinernema carpocapsae]|uniref:Uncharacterized protein n=1 Tax=Steinernema carpocapsae TaxID=34508 RepID=A0A4U8UJR8_STECR|nr:hypothetical protein L596_000166 [Steinernema carpocapsae]
MFNMKLLATGLVVLVVVIKLGSATETYADENVDEGDQVAMSKRAGHPTWRQFARVRQIAHQGSMPPMGPGGPSAFWEGSRPGFVRFVRTRPYAGDGDFSYY